MSIETARREFVGTLRGFMACLVGMLSFGALFYFLGQTRPMTTTFVIAALAVIACISAICMIVLSFHLAMSVFALIILVDSMVVLLALGGIGGPFKFFHPYGVLIGALGGLFALAKGMPSK